MRAITRVVVFVCALVLAGCLVPTPQASSTAGADGFVSMVGGHFRVRIDLTMSEAARNAGIDLVRSTERFLESIDLVLPGPRPTIWITGNTSDAIPEVGIGGLTYPESGDVVVSVDNTSVGRRTRSNGPAVVLVGRAVSCGRSLHAR